MSRPHQIEPVEITVGDLLGFAPMVVLRQFKNS